MAYNEFDPYGDPRRRRDPTFVGVAPTTTPIAPAYVNPLSPSGAGSRPNPANPSPPPVGSRAPAIAIPRPEIPSRQSNRDRAGGVDPSLPPPPRAPVPPPVPGIPDAPYTGFTPKHTYEGFDFAREQNIQKSAKDAFAYFSNQAPPPPLDNRAALAEWFNTYIAPGMNQLGHNISNVTEDKFDFSNWQGNYTIDYGRGAGAPGGALAWQVMGGDGAGADPTSGLSPDLIELLKMFQPPAQAPGPDWTSILAGMFPPAAAPTPYYAPPVAPSDSYVPPPAPMSSGELPAELLLNPGALSPALRTLSMQLPKLFATPESSDPLLASILRSIGQG